MPVSLSSSLYLLQQYGPVAPSTLTAPVRAGLGKYGDGLFVEEGTTNLVTNPSFETGTAGWSGNNATLATTTARALVGSQSMLVTASASGTLNIGSFVNVGSLTVTVGGVYTLSAWVWTAVARQFQAGIVWNGPGTTSVGTATTVPAGVLTRITATGTAPTGTTSASPTVYATASTGDTFFIDAAQVEQKGYATSYCDGSLGAGYAWTGAANASTSTRAASAARFASPVSSTSGISFACWVRVGEVTGTGQVAVSLNDGSGSNRVSVELNGTAVGFYSTKGGTFTGGPAVTMSTLSGGDVFFVVGTVTPAGVYTGYVSKNGGAVVSATATDATNYPAIPVTTVDVGAFVGTSYSDSIVEQVLIYNRVLTGTEVSNLAFNASESTFASDPGIVYAAACGAVRGTTNAHTLTGTGSYRAATSTPIACYVEPVPAFGPDAVTGATKKISVAAGSGIGQGQLVSLNAPTGGNVSTVLRVFSPGGDYDELYTT